MTLESGIAASTPLRVLIVDSDFANAGALATVAKAGGHDARVAFYDQGAMDVAAEFRPDIVLVDLIMPGMNGTRAAAEIKARAGAQALLVALTASDDQAAQEQARLAGFDQSLRKADDAARWEEILTTAALRTASATT